MPSLDIDGIGSHGRNALHTAADCGSLEMVEYFVDLGAAVDALVLGTKETALHICARRGHRLVSGLSTMITIATREVFS